MTQTTDTPAHAADDTTGAYVLSAGSYDSERTVQVVLGTFEQAQARADEMNDVLRMVHGKNTEDNLVTVSGPFDVLTHDTAVAGQTVLRVDAEPICVLFDQLHQSLDQIGHGYDDSELPAVGSGLLNARRELAELGTILMAGRG